MDFFETSSTENSLIYKTIYYWCTTWLHQVVMSLQAHSSLAQGEIVDFLHDLYFVLTLLI